MIKFWSYQAEYKNIRKKLLKSIDTTIKKGSIFFGKQLEFFEKSFMKQNKGNYGAAGSATISGEASDIKNTRSETVFAYVSTSGKAIARRTYGYLGTGTFSTFNGAAEARAIDIETPVSINLFCASVSKPAQIPLTNVCSVFTDTR